MRIFQTLLAFGGNAQPQLALTRRLLERGHDVRVLAHRAAQARVQATGAEFVAFWRVQPDLDMARRERDTLRDWQTRTRLGAGIRLVRNGLFAFVVGVSRECTEVLAQWPADVVVFDWMLSGAAITAQAAGIPAVALVHCPYPLPVRGVPPLFSGLRPMPGPAGAARDWLLNALAARMLARGLPLVNKARAEHGLQPLGRFEQQLLSVDAISVLTAAQLDFASRGRLPENVRYVGPAFEPYPAEWRSPWPEENTHPLVLVSLSTTYMHQDQLAQRILDALADLPVRALLTTGPALDTTPLRIPANTRAVPFVPHRSVLPHAALVITHAGWQTINAALAGGVPLLCIPDGRDQPDNAARVLATGAGVRAHKHTPTHALRRTITNALRDPELKRHAQAMAGLLAQADGALTIANALEQLTKDRRRPGALRA